MKKPDASLVAVGALCLVQFVDVLGVTVIVTALPAMLSGLGASTSEAAPVVTGYAMFFGGLLMLGARLGDRYGHRRVLLVGLVGFGAGSLVAATATSVPALVAGRCLQGAGAAFSVPTALRLLLAVAPDEQGRRRALAAWSAMGAAAGATGFLVGGALTDAASWRAVFWINLPLAALLAASILTTTPRSQGSRSGRLDVAGGAALTASVMGIVYGASLLGQPDTRMAGMLVLAAGAALAAVFVRIERRAPHPLIPRAAVRQPNLRTGAAASAINTATTSSAMTLATLYLQDTMGESATAAGLLLMPCSLCVVAGSAAATPLLRRRSERATIALGLAAIAIGVAVLLSVPAGLGLLTVGVAMIGAGLGVSSVAANALGTEVPEWLQGTASGALNTAAQVGTAVGVSVLLLIAGVSGRPLGWACAAAVALAAAIVLGSRRRSRTAIG